MVENLFKYIDAKIQAIKDRRIVHSHMAKIAFTGFYCYKEAYIKCPANWTAKETHRWLNDNRMDYQIKEYKKITVRRFKKMGVEGNDYTTLPCISPKSTKFYMKDERTTWRA